MSRSYRKMPIFGNTLAESEKKDKRFANRAYRRLCRVMLQQRPLLPLPAFRAFSNPWGWRKDGKQYWQEATPADMRK